LVVLASLARRCAWPAGDATRWIVGRLLLPMVQRLLRTRSIVNAVVRPDQQLIAALCRLHAAAELGELQVSLTRELTARLKAGGLPADWTVAVEASVDQLEAAVRGLQRGVRRCEEDLSRGSN
jgi:hypothetical protein